MKKAQTISLFVMLALFLILSLSIFFYLRSQGSSTQVESLSSDLQLSAQSNLVSSLVQDCLEQKAITAVDKFCGSASESKACVEQYIEYYMGDCFDPAQLKDRGINLKAGEIEVTA
jgi:hypothetical protein